MNDQPVFDVDLEGILETSNDSRNDSDELRVLQMEMAMRVIYVKM